MRRLSKQENIGFYRHLSFAVIGGYFAAYAILCRCGVMASAQTMNLLELVFHALCGSGRSVLFHAGALLIYLFGTMLTTLLPHYFHINMRHAVPIIDAAAACMIGFFPLDMPVLLSLYPIFFAMSIQWSSFPGACGFISSTIFSTNNIKQAALAFSNFLCDKEKIHFKKVRFFLSTIFCFHIGAAISFFAIQLFSSQSSFFVLPFTAWSFYLVCCEEQYEAEQLSLSKKVLSNAKHTKHVNSMS